MDTCDANYQEENTILEEVVMESRFKMDNVKRSEEVCDADKDKMKNKTGGNKDF